MKHCEAHLLLGLSPDVQAFNCVRVYNKFVWPQIYYQVIFKLVSSALNSYLTKTYV